MRIEARGLAKAILASRRDGTSGGETGVGAYPDLIDGIPPAAHKCQACDCDERHQERVLDQILSIFFSRKLKQVLGHLYLLRPLQTIRRAFARAF